jgi:PAS domain S-box-containing protein
MADELPSTESRKLSRVELAVFAAGAAIVATAITCTRLSSENWIVFWDNVHWTAAYSTAAVMASLAWRNAPDNERLPRAFFALALASYTFGQVLWDIQVYTGWNPFPGPSDAFFILLGPLLAAGYLTQLRGKLGPGEIWAARLDTAVIASAALCSTLALYLPLTKPDTTFQTAVMAAYPMLLLSAFGAGASVIVALRLKLSPGNLLMLATTLVNGLLWMAWNYLTLQEALGDGTLVNYGFSVTALLSGLSICLWDFNPSKSPAWDRLCYVVQRVLPLVLVLGAALSIALGRRLAPESQTLTDVGVVTVITLAIIRQSLLLRERERLLIAERRLRESELNYQVVADNTYDWEFWRSPEGEYLYVSPSCERISGYSAARFMEHPGLMLEIIHVSDRPAYIEHSADGFVNKIARTHSFRIVHKDGRERWIEQTSQGVFGDSGTFLGVRGSNRDVTERIESEREIRQIEEVYRKSIIAAGAVPCVESYTPHAYTFIGEQITRLTGYTPDEFTPAFLDRIVRENILRGPAAGMSMDEAIARSRRGEFDYWQCDMAIETKSGEVRWLSEVSVEMLGPDGISTGSTGLLLDITDRIVQEKEIRRIEEVYRRAIGAAGAIPYVRTHGPPDKYTFVGTRIAELTGYPVETVTPEFLQQITVNDTLLGDDAGLGVEEAIARVRSGKSHVWLSEFSIRTATGEIRWISDASAEMIGADGQSTGSVGLLLDITEQKKHEADLLESEARERLSRERLALAVDSASMGVWDLDLNGDKLTFDANMYRLYGVDPESTIDPFEVWSARAHPDDQARIHDELLQAIEGVKPYDTEFRIIWPGGEVRHIKAFARVVRTDDGVPVRVIGVNYDITERKHGEEALRESEALHRAVLELSLDGLIMMDAAGTIVEFNPAAEAIFGYKRSDVLGKNLGEKIVPPRFREAHRVGLERFVSTRRGSVLGRRLEMPALHADGHEFSVELSIVPIRSREPLLFAGAVRDITERKRSESALVDSEARERRINERFSIAVDSAGIGVWDLDIVRSTLEWDEQMYRLYQITPEDLPAGYQAWERGVHPDDLNRANEEVQLAINGVKPFDTEFRIVWPSGEVRHIKAFARVVSDSEGNPVRMTGVNFDITARKQAEAELEQYRGSLEELVRTRTKQLEDAHQALVRQERLAALGQLTATVSHELRNPFGTIRGCLFLLRDQLDHSNERAMQIFQRAERNLERCNRIIEELLDYTRLQTLEREIVEIDSWLRSTLEELPPPSGTTVNAELTCGATINIDADKLRRCVINVVSNAYDAVRESREGNRTVHVATAAVDGHVLIRVTDTGPGVKGENMTRIWEPLFTTKGFGVGLGLPHAKQLIELHGGTIRVDNMPDGGACFTITLPC